MKRGTLTEAQYDVLAHRGKGLTQRETAKALGTTRANVSMIESRARRKVLQARLTVDAFQSTLTDHLLRVPKGTRFYDVPPAVLREGDHWGIHLQSSMADIVKMVRGTKPNCLHSGRTSRDLYFVLDRSGKVRLEKGSPGISRFGGARPSQGGRLAPADAR